MSINQPQINECRKQVRETAKRMLSGELSYIEGGHQIFHLLNDCRVDTSKSPFVVFTGLVSETDHFPLGLRRRHWNADALAELDKEREQAEEWAKKFSREACHQLLIAPDLDPMLFP